MPPDDVIESFPATDPSSVRFRPIESYNRSHCRQHPGSTLRLEDILFRFHADHIAGTDFVRFSIFFDLRPFPEARDRFLLYLLGRVWMSSPIRVNSTYVK